MLFRISCQPDTVIAWDQQHSHSRCKAATSTATAAVASLIFTLLYLYCELSWALFTTRSRTFQIRSIKAFATTHTHKMHLIKRKKRDTCTIILSVLAKLFRSFFLVFKSFFFCSDFFLLLKCANVKKNRILAAMVYIQNWYLGKFATKPILFHSRISNIGKMWFDYCFSFALHRKKKAILSTTILAWTNVSQSKSVEINNTMAIERISKIAYKSIPIFIYMSIPSGI